MVGISTVQQPRDWCPYMSKEEKGAVACRTERSEGRTTDIRYATLPPRRLLLAQIADLRAIGMPKREVWRTIREAVSK